MMTEGEEPNALPMLSDRVVVGRLGASYGVQGWHHIISFTRPPSNILRYTQWYVQQKGQWVLMEQIAGRPHGDGIVAHLKGVETPEHAAQLTNSLIAVAREELATLAPDEFYWADLENLPVQTVQGKILGCIAYLYENAGLDVMVVKNKSQEYHIPFIWNETVLAVDLAAKKVTIDWDPEL